MFYLGVSWAMDLLTHFLHYTSLIIFRIHLLSLLSCFFLHLEWYFFTFQCMKDSCIMDIVLGSLVEKVILSILVFESVFISLCILNGAHFFYIQSMRREKKRKKKAYVLYVYNVFLFWVCILAIESCFFEVIAYESSYVSFQMFFSLCAYLVMYFMCERRVTFS